MTPQKRKADSASLVESSDTSPHKRARSEKADDIADKQNGAIHLPGKLSDDNTEHSVSVAGPSIFSNAAPNEEIKATPPGDLPQTWDQAGAADKMLVKIKGNAKIPWAKIEKVWEELTGEKPGKGMLQDRYGRLKEIIAHSKVGSIVEGTMGSKITKEALETSESISTLPTNGLRPLSPVNSGPSDESLHALSQPSKTPAQSPDIIDAAPARGIAPEQDLPQSWEQADPGDRLLVEMKTGRKAWARIEEAWKKLTGETPAEGALRDRYMRIKDLVKRPKTNGAYTHTYPVEANTVYGVSDQAISRRAKPPFKKMVKREAEAEPLEESLDKSLDETPDGPSDELAKHSETMSRRKSRNAAKQQLRDGAFGERPGNPIAKPTKTAGEEASDTKADAESSDESIKTVEYSRRVPKSARSPQATPEVAASSKAHNLAETADGMVVEMRERGCDWIDISKAWTERTGLTRAPETLRKRYSRIKKGSAAKLKSIAPASSKRKAKATSPDESSAKRRKSMGETARVVEAPIKRNMDRGKRKLSVKYTDSTTDEDELYAEPVEPITITRNKRNAGRAAKVDRNDPEWLVTNEKSPLANEDLHAEFSDPKTYENFTKSDWEDLRETLPPNIPINPDGYSIPMTFFKYDPDFRRGIREFQEDLASGRLDPKWQADAAQAMEERARGEFDAYKEDQFEAFWGQKQKLNHDALAGESTRIKLDMLIQNEIFKVGDYFSYSRVFGRGKNGVLVEKDCKIVKVNGKALTFAIPPEQRKYSRHMFELGNSGDTELEAKAFMANGDEQPPTNADYKPGAAQVVVDTKTNGDEASEGSEKSDEALAIKETAKNGEVSDSNEVQDAELKLQNEINRNDLAGAINSEGTVVEAIEKPQENEILERTTPEENSPEAPAQTSGGDSSTPAIQDEDVLHSISILTQLENKIVDIDGRFDSKEIATQNTWRSFRGIRDNQDLGTLFEMREEFYVYKHPRIVKEGKKKR